MKLFYLLFFLCYVTNSYTSSLERKVTFIKQEHSAQYSSGDQSVHEFDKKTILQLCAYEQEDLQQFSQEDLKRYEAALCKKMFFCIQQLESLFTPEKDRMWHVPMLELERSKAILKKKKS